MKSTVRALLKSCFDSPRTLPKKCRAMRIGIFTLAVLTAYVGVYAWATNTNNWVEPTEIDQSTDPPPGIISSPAPSEVVATLAWGELTIGRNIQRQTRFIRRVATETERRIAEQNAAAYYAQLSRSQKAELKKTKRYWAVPVTKKRVTKPGRKVPPEQPKEEPKEEAKANDVIIYDPLSGSIVNKYVYTLETLPAPETPISLDGYEPLLYVGR